MNEVNPIRKKFNPLPLMIIIFVLVTSSLASGLYFFYLRNLNNEIKDTSEQKEEKFEKALITFSLPSKYSVEKEENSLSILSENNLVTFTLKDFDKNLLTDSQSLVIEKGYMLSSEKLEKIGERAGLSYTSGEKVIMFFPTSFENYLIIETDVLNEELQEIINSIKFNSNLANGN